MFLRSRPRNILLLALSGGALLQLSGCLIGAIPIAMSYAESAGLASLLAALLG